VLVGEDLGEEIDRDAGAAVVFVGCQWQAARPVQGRAGQGEPTESFRCCRRTGDPSSSF
jgi:hypothetical protein